MGRAWVFGWLLLACEATDVVAPDARREGAPSDVGRPEVGPSRDAEPPSDAARAPDVGPRRDAQQLPDGAGPDPTPDGARGSPDAASPDAASSDAASPDAAPHLDAAVPDAAPDVSTADGVADGVAPDGPVPDVPAPPDLSPPDAGPPPDACVGCGCFPEVEVCGLAPPECEQVGGPGGPVGGRTTEGVTTGLRLLDDGAYEERLAAIRQVEAHRSVRRVGYVDLLADLNRQGERVGLVPGAQCLDLAFRFNDGDHAVDYWWPQGLTGSADANAENEVAGEKVAIVSWYHKPAEDPSTDVNKGARLSFVRTTDLDDPDYRNLLLVEPYVDDAGRATFKPVPTHAGGIVWFGDLLYVADTSRGFRVFDLSWTLRVATGDNDAIGYRAADDAYHGFNYRYVVPMVRHYTRCEASCCARFSFAGLDRTSDQPSIISGGYTDQSHDARLHRWPLEPGTGLLAEVDGVVHPTQVVYPNAIRMQGALSVGDTWYVSSSDPKLSLLPAPGTLYVTRVGQQPDERGFPLLPEDLHYSMQSRRLWSVTERPSHRYVFAVETDCD